MLPSLDLRDDVVDVLRRVPAVLAAMIVPHEHRTSTQRQGTRVGHGNISAKTHDRRDVDLGLSGVPRLAEVCHGIGRAAHHEHHTASSRYHRERLVAGIEHERSCHGRKRTKAILTCGRPLDP